MTPLTHAAVGMAICQHLRSRRLGRFGWAIALALAFASHYLLDSIPHIDSIGPLQGFRFSGLLFPALGLIGAGFAVYLFPRNREAGLIWILLSVWIGVAGLSGTFVHGLAAVALCGFLAYRTRRVEAAAFFLAGILAISADFVPRSIRAAAKFHDSMHFSVSWGTSLFRTFQPPPLPAGTLARLQDPYFQLGYAMELIAEAVIFLTAFWSLSRLALERKAELEPAASVPEPEETRAPV